MILELNTPKGSTQQLGDGLSQALVAQGDAPYAAAVRRGNVYVQAAQATVTTQAGLSATTPAISVSANIASGKVVKLWYAGYTSLVAGAAAGTVWLCANAVSATAVVHTTPSVTVYNAKTGAVGAPGGVSVDIVSTLPAAPIAIAVLGGVTTAAITTAPNSASGGRWFGGALWSPAGSALSIQTSTALTLFTEMIFEVVDDDRDD